MKSTQSVYNIAVKTIDGAETNLATYRGKKILLVNVASECGYTPQYKDLQKLQEQFGSKVVVLGFPSNDFGGQEPGSNAEIKNFCERNYKITFPMFD
ncbi:MAG TPA: glutathione peroxidase, partial [bacterium]|nr:glutathione peroxidase [bacterium]